MLTMDSVLARGVPGGRRIRASTLSPSISGKALNLMNPPAIILIEMKNRAMANDLEILEQYRGKEVAMELPAGCYGGIVGHIGAEFISLAHCKNYSHTSLSNFRYKDLSNYEEIPNRTISRSEIEQIISMEDLRKSLEKPRTEKLIGEIE